MAPKRKASKKGSISKGRGGSLCEDEKKADASSSSSKDMGRIGKICAVVAFVLYANSVLLCEFPFDDGPAVKNNPDVLDTRGDGRMSSFADVWRHDFWGTDVSSAHTHKSYRPLVVLSFRLDALLSREAWIFHLTNTLLYSFTTWLVVHTVLATALPTAAVTAPLKNKRLVLLLSGLWFAAHPIHAESVAGIVGRAEILAAILCLFATKLYRQRNIRSLLASAACFAAACLCKETAVVMPIMISIVDVATALLAPNKGPSSPTIDGALARTTCMVAVSSAYLSLRSFLFAGMSTITNLRLEDNFMQHLRFMDKLRTALFIQTKYVQLLIWPSSISCDYSLGVIVPVQSFFSLKFAFVIVVAAMIVALTLFALTNVRTYGDSTLLLALGWTFAPLLPASHIVDIGTVMAERLLFMPSIGMTMMLCNIIGLRAADFKVNDKYGVSFIAIIVWFGMKTLARVPQWADSYTLFDADVMSHPDSLKLLLMTARTTTNRNAKEAEAFDHARRAKEITDRHLDALTKGPYLVGIPEMAQAKIRTSNWPEGANLTEALEYVDLITDHGIKDYKDWSFIQGIKGGALLRRGMASHDKSILAEAVDSFDTAIEYDKDGKASHPLFCDYGLTLAVLGRNEEAFPQFIECFRRQAHVEKEIELVIATNFANLCMELGGVKTNNVTAAKIWGEEAIKAVDRVLNHSAITTNEKKTSTWKNVRHSIVTLMMAKDETPNDTFETDASFVQDVVLGKGESSSEEEDSERIEL